MVTCADRKNQQDAQRATWVKDCEWADVRFFMGRKSLAALHTGDTIEGFGDVRGRRAEYANEIEPVTMPYETGDEVFLDVGDDYQSLPSKVQQMAVWSQQNNYDLTLKTDDDVMLWPTRVVVPKGHYTGWKQEPTKGVSHCAGIGYWFSRDSAKVISTAKLTAQSAEDRWVGEVLSAAGMRAEQIASGGLQWVGKIGTRRPQNIRAILRRAYIAGEFTAAEMPNVYRY